MTHSPTHPELERTAVCLVSGGMDSAVVLAEAVDAGFLSYALTVNYGQRHAVEIEAARRVAAALGAVEHRVVAVDLRAIGGSALTGTANVPKGRGAEEIGRGIPATYVPARNALLLSIALGWAEVLGAADLFLGVNAIDYSGYPDCRPAFLRSFEAMARQATAAGTESKVELRVHAPLLRMSKADIVRRAGELGVDLALTHTCYDPLVQGGEILACGCCDACILRLEGFRRAGSRDPIRYATRPTSASPFRGTPTT